MNRIKTVGFPKMGKEPGERRVFLPGFLSAIAALGCTAYLEEGYGSELGYSFQDYQGQSDRIIECSKEKAFHSDLIVLLRAPERHEFNLLKGGSCIISMLHFPTRPWRVQALLTRKVEAVAMDQITDDGGNRIVEYFHAVAWNGLDTAFSVLEQKSGEMFQRETRPISVLVLGVGKIGKLAVEAATKMGSPERNSKYISGRCGGSIAVAVGRNVTSREDIMKNLLGAADILVDTTQRNDPSRPVISNRWIDYLPEHAVITDLSVDPYLLNEKPAVVRGIEGIPRGNLDKYIFYPDDPEWTATIPAGIPSTSRRTTVSCYSWPGIHPEECMKHYGGQLLPFITILIRKGYKKLNPEGDWAERALFRGTLKAYCGKN